VHRVLVPARAALDPQRNDTDKSASALSGDGCALNPLFLGGASSIKQFSVYEQEMNSLERQTYPGSTNVAQKVQPYICRFGSTDIGDGPIQPPDFQGCGRVACTGTQTEQEEMR
jgi:hypothetical protein